MRSPPLSLSLSVSLSAGSSSSTGQAEGRGALGGTAHARPREGFEPGTLEERTGRQGPGRRSATPAHDQDAERAETVRAQGDGRHASPRQGRDLPQVDEGDPAGGRGAGFPALSVSEQAPPGSEVPPHAAGAAAALHEAVFPAPRVSERAPPGSRVPAPTAGAAAAVHDVPGEMPCSWGERDDPPDSGRSAKRLRQIEVVPHGVAGTPPGRADTEGDTGASPACRTPSQSWACGSLSPAREMAPD